MTSATEQTSDVASTFGRRTGATWVAATGAFLLLAAATVFVATRWNDIPEAAKLIVLIGITGACVLIGDRLRTSLPATGNALFHLGAFLIPVDGVALGMRAQLGWESMLLGNAILAAAALTILAIRSKSVVLAAGASAAVMAVAAGVGAVSNIPAPLVLAVFALIATWYAGTERHALVWAAVAGIAPVATLALNDAFYGRGVATDLGVLAVRPWIASVAAGVVAAFVVARSARLRNEPALALISVAALVAHGIAGWTEVAVPEVVQILALPSLFLAIELAILAARRDEFWAKPAHTIGSVVEALASVPTAWAIPATLLVLHFNDINGGDIPGSVAIGAGLVALAWIVAGVRRDASTQTLVASLTRGPQWAPAIPAAIAAGLAALTVATMSPVAVSVAALATGCALLLAQHRHAALTSFALASYATIAATADARFALAIGGAAALLSTLGIVRARTSDQVVLGLLTGFGTLGIGIASTAPEVPLVLSGTLWVGLCWLLGIAADRDADRAGDVGRVFAFGVLLFSVAWAPEQALFPSLLLAAVAVADGVRLRRRDLMIAAALPLVHVQLLLASLADLDVAGSGLALTIAATVWLGLAALADEPWRTPLAIVGGLTGIVGLFAASTDLYTFGPALFIAGGVGIALGFLTEKEPIVHLGAIIATLGTWVTFGAREITYAELYAIPVAAHLLGAGFTLRRRAAEETRPNSWVAYAPGIALLVAAAMSERLAGGTATHSLVAGAIAIVAIIAGGYWRLAGPLVVGTATLVLVVGRESFDTAAGIPTWAWLAAGGATLIGAAVSMERNDVSPVEAGRRVVDVMASHFD